MIQQRQMMVKVPVGSAAGQKLVFLSPSGITHSAIIPAGVAAGQTITVQYSEIITTHRHQMMDTVPISWQECPIRSSAAMPHFNLAHDGTCEFEIVEGSLGINISSDSNNPVYQVAFEGFNRKAADKFVTAQQLAHGKLKPNMYLTHVNGQDIGGRQYTDVREMLRQRPCCMRWCGGGCSVLVRSGTLGLGVRDKNKHASSSTFAYCVQIDSNTPHGKLDVSENMASDQTRQGELQPGMELGSA
jgi:hypothetical protein